MQAIREMNTGSNDVEKHRFKTEVAITARVAIEALLKRWPADKEIDAKALSDQAIEIATTHAHNLVTRRLI